MKRRRIPQANALGAFSTSTCTKTNRQPNPIAWIIAKKFNVTYRNWPLFKSGREHYVSTGLLRKANKITITNTIRANINWSLLKKSFNNMLKDITLKTIVIAPRSGKDKTNLYWTNCIVITRASREILVYRPPTDPSFWQICNNSSSCDLCYLTCDFRYLPQANIHMLSGDRIGIDY